MSDFNTQGIVGPSRDTALLCEAWGGCFTNKPAEIVHHGGEVTVEGLGFGNSTTARRLDLSKRLDEPRGTTIASIRGEVEIILADLNNGGENSNLGEGWVILRVILSQTGGRARRCWRRSTG